MGGLRRFEEYRFVGARDRMRFYDTDDSDQLEALRLLVDGYDLDGRNLLQSFAPDTEAEARNRGFKTARA